VTSVEEARRVIDELIEHHPNDRFLKVASSLLLVQGSDRSQAIAALQQLSTENPDDGYVRQVLAGLLAQDKSTWSEAWLHFRAALDHGPLLTPSYKSAAYYLAKREDPDTSQLAFAGTGIVERTAIRTRSLEISHLLLINKVLVLPAFALEGLGEFRSSAVLLVVASLWSAWVAFANSIVGCWKCVRAWLVLLTFPWLVFACARYTSLRDVAWFVIGGIIMGDFIPWAKKHIQTTTG
jgi:hypothetical protein